MKDHHQPLKFGMHSLPSKYVYVEDVRSNSKEKITLNC